MFAKSTASPKQKKLQPGYSPKPRIKQISPLDDNSASDDPSPSQEPITPDAEPLPVRRKTQ
ncbi:MAG: hypothetical protein ACLQVY_08175 [Limisphaerales bacterium]